MKHMKPDFILNLEQKENTFYSVTHLGEIKTKKELEDGTFLNVYQDSVWKDPDLLWNKKILKTKHSFYLFIERNELYKTIFNIKVYHTPEQKNELIFFLKNYLKTIL